MVSRRREPAVPGIDLEINDGRIDIGDRDVTTLPPKDRDIAMVFQNHALHPHVSVEDNMGHFRLAHSDPRDQ